MEKNKILKLFKLILRKIRIIWITFGYRYKCKKLYWVFYLFLNIPFCSVYHAVLLSDGVWVRKIRYYAEKKLNKIMEK